jgi:hypothetical protein
VETPLSVAQKHLCVAQKTHYLGSKLNRTVLNSCGNPIIRSAKTRDIFVQPGFVANGAIHIKKEAKQGSWQILETSNK